jgi:hypothetical protein
MGDIAVKSRKRQKEVTSFNFIAVQIAKDIPKIEENFLLIFGWRRVENSE